MAQLLQTPVSLLDIHWMSLALEQAHRAKSIDEVPVGAIVVHQEQVVGLGYNQLIQLNDPSAHAEMQAIRQACHNLKNYRLPGASLYVTLEPCTMCLGVIIHSRIQRLVFATAEPRAGALISQAALSFAPYNHSLEFSYGALADESSELLKNFFVQRRAQKINQANLKLNI